MSKPQIWNDESIGVSTALRCQSGADSGSGLQYKLVTLIDKEKPFICGECSGCFRTRHDALQHIIRRHNPPKFQCFQCPKRYPYCHLLKRHVEAKHGEVRKRIPCRMCYLNWCQNTSSGDYSCLTCAKYIKDLVTVGSDVPSPVHPGRIHPHPSWPPASICRPGPVPPLFPVFEISTSEIGLYKCVICTENEYFGTKKQLDAHYMYKHKPITKYKCKICKQKSYADLIDNERALYQHHRSEHREEELNIYEEIDIYECPQQPQCFTIYGKRSNLIAHIKRCHKILTSYICIDCQKEYKNKKALQQHVDYTHRGKREHTCDTCGVSFSSKSKLNDHKKTHEKPSVRCPYCSKMFYHQSNMMRHRRSRHEGKRFACTYCNAAFTSNAYLTKHVMRRHKEEVENDKI